MDIRSLQAGQGYGAARASLGAPLAGPDVKRADGPANFARVAQDFVDTMKANEQVTKDALTGKADAHSVVEALAATELAIETAVTVRDKVVEAYQEILRMPV